MNPAAKPRRAKPKPARRAASRTAGARKRSIGAAKPARAAKPATGRAKPASTAKPSAAANDFAAVSAALSKILDPYESPLLLRVQGKTGFWLYSTKVGPNKHAFAFAGVRVGKGYVSYHLVPVYMNPALRKRISPALMARMQGMACFNFKRPDPVLFKELAALTQVAFQDFRTRGYL